MSRDISLMAVDGTPSHSLHGDGGGGGGRGRGRVKKYIAHALASKVGSLIVYQPREGFSHMPSISLFIRATPSTTKCPGTSGRNQMCTRQWN